MPRYLARRYAACTSIYTDTRPLTGTATGVIQRDEIVFTWARSRNIPITMVLSGGYQRTNAEVIANSLSNLHKKGLIDLTYKKAKI